MLDYNQVPINPRIEEINKKRGYGAGVDDVFNSQRHPLGPNRLRLLHLHLLPLPSSPLMKPSSTSCQTTTLPHPHSDESSRQPSHSSPADPSTSLSFPSPSRSWIYQKTEIFCGCCKCRYDREKHPRPSQRPHYVQNASLNLIAAHLRH